jgi:hypothetical protein
MFVELAKFASFLLLVVTLCDVFHHAFLVPSSELPERIWSSLRLLICAAGLSFLSGYLFRVSELKASGSKSATRISSTFPVQVFLWTSGGILLLFLLAWVLETYFLPWSHSH